MDPSSLIAALEEAVAAGLVAMDLYRSMRAALDAHGRVSFADVVGGGSSTAPSGRRRRHPRGCGCSECAGGYYEPTWRRHPRGCECFVCLERLRKARQLDDDVAEMFGR